jgi:hypothetical protein
MPSRKQRRRRAKERRHEYEYVYVDDEGHEVEVDPAELREEREKPKSNGRSAGNGNRRGGAARGASGVRVVEPPSWRRVRKRALIIGPLMFIFVTFLSKNLTVAGRIIQTVVMLALFLPFSYLMDRTLYRAYLRRTGGHDPKASARR